MLDYYVPSSLLVMISWVSFFLEPTAIPGRTTLGKPVFIIRDCFIVSTVSGTASWLTFINLHKNINDKVSKVQYIKYIDIWFMTSTIFIFFSLLEFAIVNSIVRGRYPISHSILTKIQELFKKQIERIKKQKKKAELKGKIHLSNVTRSEVDYANAILIDRIARVMFPLSWFSFELIYFFYLVEAHKTVITEGDEA